MNHPPPAPHGLRPETWALAFALVIALAFIIIPTYLDSIDPSQSGEWFVGSDTYMRMLRVWDWWNGGAWYENLTARSNWPYGETLHWTRPFDILLMILAAPFTPFVSLHKALYFSGMIISPILFMGTIWVMVVGTRSLLDGRGRIILVLLITFQPITHSYYVVARPDHHSLILLSFATVLTLLVRHIADPKGKPFGIAGAGAAAAFGIWISIESLGTELFALLALGFLWLWHGEDVWLHALRRFTLVGAGIAMVALAIERPPEEWLTAIEFDRISIVHVVLLALIALGIEALWRTRARTSASLIGRMLAAFFVAAAAAGVMDVLFPDFFKGPFGAAMNPRLNSLWLSKVQEFQPLVSADPNTWVSFVLVLGPITWLAVWGALARKSATPTNGRMKVWFTLVVAVGIYAPLTVAQSRWGAYMGIIVVIGWAILLQRLLDWQGGPRSGDTPLLRVPVFALVAIGHILLAALINVALPAKKPEKTTACHWRALSPFLNSTAFAQGKPQTLLSFIHEGPEILYRTHHRVIGTPYHRNAHGLLDNFAALMSTNEAESKAVFVDRGVDFMLTCIGSVEEKFFLAFKGNTLMRKIANGKPPTWLKPEPLPAGLEKYFHLYRFDNTGP